MAWLITGGYGCIGSWVAKNLLDAGENVYIYDLKQNPSRMNWIMPPEQVAKVNFIEGNITDLSTLRTALERHQIRHIIHLAGLQVPICRADPILGAQVNVVGTLTVFEAVKSLGKQLDRVVYASSAAVFGPPEDEFAPPVHDADQKTPTTHYGFYKAANEGNARIYFMENGIASVGIRPATVYGVGRDFGMTSEPTKALLALSRGEKFHISFGGWQDMQYADDVAKSFIAAASRNKNYHDAAVFNLKGTKVEIATIHKTMCQIDPKAAKLITFGDKHLPVAYDFSDEGLQTHFGPLPITTLEAGMRQTLEMFRKIN